MDLEYALELGKAGYVIAQEMCRIKEGESGTFNS